MPRHAAKRSSRTRRFSAGGAVTVGTFALACTALFGTAVAAQAAPATKTTKAAQATKAIKAALAAKVTASTYTVQRGDHLASIARAHKVPGGWPAIATANHLVSPYILQPGQVLTLPTGSATATAPAKTTAAPATVQTYANNLDGWIKHSLAVMKQNGIPGSYNGIYRNVIRESSGNPMAINLWDSNAAAGIPSKGLLQVIQPTFNTYHVAGTSWNIYDPVANITAACNYAYHRYGSIDNVNGPY
ncbi:LysM peptidoglycan-binding domain-containing protein [Streptomyces gibsoniae]|uniref:LysM peptidoglycan-binding domain-containing protein n=1 Tax=Streptomyces gibsoniae TaxID=3075529 RepID=A0ABU2TYD6_9ACTN|nr:LysM peptidoglycan-binding domain-containing protein [Streptomyces sp. DSM 41699]MDT0465980.1 LysM peptidoglycan-binding domain-containing protein [Streptomyces sp. DSM 41699]